MPPEEALDLNRTWTIRRPLALLAIGAAVLVTAGCGDDDEPTAEATTSTSTAAAATGVDQEKLDAAVEEYDSYVESEATALVEATDEFVALVDSGDIDGAKDVYPGARVHFERIEPVAGAFGDLDPDIDGREGDIPKDEWGGYHRIEKALWIEESTDGLEEIAAELVDDVNNLEGVAEREEFEAPDIAQGSVDLLAEVSSSKITGEEERYSHTDLWDFEANVAGAEAGFEALAPALEEVDAELVERIRGEFEETYALLDEYREGDGYVLYDTLSEQDTRGLAQRIDALGESISRVPALVG
jgi:iron uptake system component EfeO